MRRWSSRTTSAAHASSSASRMRRRAPRRRRASARASPRRRSCARSCRTALFPTAAYVGGPAECSYLGQCAALYDLFDLPVPLVAPRARFRLIDGRTRARLDALGLVARRRRAADGARCYAAVGRAAPGADRSPRELRAAILDAPLDALRHAAGAHRHRRSPARRAPSIARAPRIERAVDRLTARYARTLALRDGECTQRAAARRARSSSPTASRKSASSPFPRSPPMPARARSSREYSAPVKPFDPAVQDLVQGQDREAARHRHHLLSHVRRQRHRRHRDRPRAGAPRPSRPLHLRRAAGAARRPTRRTSPSTRSCCATIRSCSRANIRWRSPRR